MAHTLTRYACYYGAGRLETLAGYDLVILQPAHYSRTEVAALRAAGVTVIAYLAIGELPDLDVQRGWMLRDPLTGYPARNDVWQTTCLDCRSPAWQAEVLERRVPALCEQGFEGLFLDTLDVQERYPDTRPGVVALVRQIRAQFPLLQLVPNRGFSITPAIADVSDALLFEAFSTFHTRGGYAAWDEAARAWTEQRARELRVILGGKPVLALDYAATEDLALHELAQQRAAEHGFLSFVSIHTLDWLPE